MAVGHAREKRPGRWELKVYVGRDPLRPERKVYEYSTVDASNRTEAEKKLVLFAAKVMQSAPKSTITFGELLERWFEIAGPRMVPAGRTETRRMIDTRLKPLHDRPLAEMGSRSGTAILDEFYAALRERGGVCRLREKCIVTPCRHGDVCTLPGRCDRLPCKHGGGQPLSGATVVRTHVVVRGALEQAVKWGLVDRNPADHAYPGEADAEEVDPPLPADVVRMFELAAAQNPELVVFLVLASTTGARKGRVLALWWEDIDFERGLVTYGHVISLGESGPERVVAGRGKRNRKGGKVVVPVDPAVLAMLMAQRSRAEARAALIGAPLPSTGYVFSTDPLGRRPWHPRTLSRHFSALRAKAGLDETRLHDLRHFVISYLLDAGVDIATVKELVGHSASSTTTLATYAHARTDSKRAATGILARLLELNPEPDDDSGQPLAEVVPLRRPS